MRSQNQSVADSNRAFTLVELLVVIAIIAVLAGLVLAGVMTVKSKGIVGRAKVETTTIVAAIAQYKAEYGVPPAPKQVWDFSAANKNATADFSYGTGMFRTYGSSSFEIDNSQLIAILRDTGPTAFLNNLAITNNSKKISYLDAPIAANNISGGVGSDGVFRDPWGNPYIISVDMDESGTTTDGFYRKLIETKVRTVSGNANYPLEITASAVVWSLGPDGKASENPTIPPGVTDPKKILKAGDNADNVLSWDK